MLEEVHLWAWAWMFQNPTSFPVSALCLLVAFFQDVNSQLLLQQGNGKKMSFKLSYCIKRKDLGVSRTLFLA